MLFVCGAGNNGGDGCAAARLWMQQGGRADVWLLKSPSQMKGDAGVNACLLNSCGAALNVLYNEAPEIPADCAAVVDALYGTGLSRELEGVALYAVQRMNESGLPIVAVDTRPAWTAATGQVLGDAVHAAQTVTFHRAKHGLMIYPGRAYTGKLTVCDIGILPEWDGAQGYDVLEEDDVRALLPARPRDGNKGTFGHVLSVAGSRGPWQALRRSAQGRHCGRARAGDGGVPFAVLNTVQAQAPCAMAKVVSDGAELDAGAAELLTELAKGKAALAIGPGLGRTDGAWLAVEALVRSRYAEGHRRGRAFPPGEAWRRRGGKHGADAASGRDGKAVRYNGSGGSRRTGGIRTAACGGSGRVCAAQGRDDHHRAG